MTKDENIYKLLKELYGDFGCRIEGRECKRGRQCVRYLGGSDFDPCENFQISTEIAWAILSISLFKKAEPEDIMKIWEYAYT